MSVIDDYEQIVKAFNGVLTPLNKLCGHLFHELLSLPMVILNETAQWCEDRNRLNYVLQHFSPKLGLKPTETFNCPGAVAATLQTFELIEALNKAKDHFKQTVLAYKKSKLPGETMTPAGKILAKAGYGYVKLKQAYRHIHIVDYHPDKISWTQAKNACYQPISHREAMKRLLNAGQGPHIEIQITKLNELTGREKLIFYTPIKPSWTANILKRYPQNGLIKKKTVRTSLPLFYLYDPSLPLPHVRLSKAKTKKTQITPRKNRTVENEPFLKSIHVYKLK